MWGAGTREEIPDPPPGEFRRGGGFRVGESGSLRLATHWSFVPPDFPGLAGYLDREHERVDWIESRNLPTRDPQTAACLMRSAARDSERVHKPVYHLSISFDPGDPVDPETMRRVADRTLRDLGLQKHQALIVAHNDRHPDKGVEGQATEGMGRLSPQSLRFPIRCSSPREEQRTTIAPSRPGVGRSLSAPSAPSA